MILFIVRVWSLRWLISMQAFGLEVWKEEMVRTGGGGGGCLSWRASYMNDYPLCVLGYKGKWKRKSEFHHMGFLASFFSFKYNYVSECLRKKERGDFRALRKCNKTKPLTCFLPTLLPTTSNFNLSLSISWNYIILTYPYLFPSYLPQSLIYSSI